MITAILYLGAALDALDEGDMLTAKVYMMRAVQLLWEGVAK